MQNRLYYSVIEVYFIATDRFTNRHNSSYLVLLYTKQPLPAADYLQYYKMHNVSKRDLQLWKFI
jgi:hypothetical protein